MKNGPHSRMILKFSLIMSYTFGFLRIGQRHQHYILSFENFFASGHMSRKCISDNSITERVEMEKR